MSVIGRVAVFAVVPLLTVPVAGCKDNGTIAPGVSAGPSVGSSVSTTSAPTAAPSSSTTASAAPSSALASTDVNTASEQLKKQILVDSGLDKGPSQAPYSDVQKVKVGAYEFEAPTAWSAVSQKSVEGNVDGKHVYVSADDKKFRALQTAGIAVAIFASQSPAQALPAYLQTEPYFKNCQAGPKHDYNDGQNIGVAQTFAECNGKDDPAAVTIVGVAPKTSAAALVFVTVTYDERDIEAVAHAILSTSLAS